MSSDKAMIIALTAFVALPFGAMVWAFETLHCKVVPSYGSWVCTLDAFLRSLVG